LPATGSASVPVVAALGEGADQQPAQLLQDTLRRRSPESCRGAPGGLHPHQWPGAEVRRRPVAAAGWAGLVPEPAAAASAWPMPRGHLGRFDRDDLTGEGWAERGAAGACRRRYTEPGGRPAPVPSLWLERRPPPSTQGRPGCRMGSP